MLQKPGFQIENYLIYDPAEAQINQLTDSRFAAADSQSVETHYEAFTDLYTRFMAGTVAIANPTVIVEYGPARTVTVTNSRAQRCKSLFSKLPDSVELRPGTDTPADRVSQLLVSTTVKLCLAEDADELRTTTVTLGADGISSVEHRSTELERWYGGYFERGNRVMSPQPLRQVDSDNLANTYALLQRIQLPAAKRAAFRLPFIPPQRLHNSLRH